mmetsp:Transcript_26766/g.35649  ORF Transcript_26766/g.35649 Transcript_26766/m.35649 type:complete len:92 (-) Transcript_26766:779-1054(-)
MYFIASSFFQLQSMKETIKRLPLSSIQIKFQFFFLFSEPHGYSDVAYAKTKNKKQKPPPNSIKDRAFRGLYILLDFLMKDVFPNLFIIPPD